jgi:hypothetical protein
MAQTNFTPILLYASSTAAAVPLAANLTNSATGSEIAINVADKNLFFKDSGGVVNTVPIRQSSTSSNGWLSSTDWNTFNGKGTGSVTSVAASVPAFLSIAGSPITTSGTLAISYSGTALPVANGGTATTTAFTTGSVVFAGASGVYTQDNANLFWDNTNDRLGIGTTGPTAALDVVTSASAVGLSLRGRASDSISDFSIKSNDGATVYGQIQGRSTDLRIASNSTIPTTFFTNGNERARIFSSGGVSIGNTTDPGATNLSVTGKVTAPNLQGPAFSAVMSANQTVTTSTYTKVNFNTEDFDTNSNYDTTNYRFTPTVAGYYQVTACIYPSTTISAINCAIYKNGANVKTFGGTTVSALVSALIYFNGSTDYVECYGYLVGTTPAILSTATVSYFQATLVRSA